jgi:hypothetical protein
MILTEERWIGLWSLTNGLLPLGATLGALSSGYMADYFGRYFVHVLKPSSSE